MGLIATDYIETNTDLIKVPREMLVTTKIAYMSEIKIIF
jgi:hypothetical protein